jgi:hypothetical protein
LLFHLLLLLVLLVLLLLLATHQIPRPLRREIATKLAAPPPAAS